MYVIRVKVGRGWLERNWVKCKGTQYQVTVLRVPRHSHQCNMAYFIREIGTEFKGTHRASIDISAGISGCFTEEGRFQLGPEG